MSRTKTGDNWEVGSDDAPPALLAAAMMDGERLLWAKSLPSSHFVQLWLWFGAVSALFAILFFYFAPWGQSIAEYCVAHKGLFPAILIARSVEIP